MRPTNSYSYIATTPAPTPPIRPRTSRVLRRRPRGKWSGSPLPPTSTSRPSPRPLPPSARSSAPSTRLWPPTDPRCPRHRQPAPRLPQEPRPTTRCSAYGSRSWQVRGQSEGWGRGKLGLGGVMSTGNAHPRYLQTTQSPHREQRPPPSKTRPPNPRPSPRLSSPSKQSSTPNPCPHL